MKQCTSISVWFFIRRTRLGRSGETPIIMRITINGQNAELNTQRKVLPSLWDQRRERTTGKGAVLIEINRHLKCYVSFPWRYLCGVTPSCCLKN